jgi:phage tail sheath protein FI
MVQLVSRASDVRIQEINLSQVITATSTAIACLPIISKQGSLKPLFFSNADTFLDEYGNPDPSISHTIQAGINFFTEGSGAWAIRVVGTDYKTSGALVYDVNGVTKIKSVGLQDPSNTDLSTLVEAGEQALFLIHASRGPGSYGNQIGIKVTSKNVGAPENAVAMASTGGSLSASTYSYQISALSNKGESLPTSPIEATVDSSGSVALSWNLVPNAIGYRIYGRDSFGLLTTVGAGATSFTDTGLLEPDANIVPQTAKPNSGVSLFTVSVYDLANPNSSSMEDWDCSLNNNVDGSGVQTEIESRINSVSQFVAAISNAAGLDTIPEITETTKTALGGGDSGTAPTSYDVARTIQVFKNKQVYGLNMLVNSGLADPIVQMAMDSLVQYRGDAVALLDVPSTKQTYQKSVDYRNLELNLNSTYSALFAPDLLQADYINGKQVYNPPSGWAAALCARTDRVANPAYSIAGLNRGLLNVLKARHQYDDGEATYMYNAQVNYSRTFIGQGIALWEQQTLSAQKSALSWLSVRRIVNVIKTATYKFLLYALQEMPTDSVRRQLVNSNVEYLDTIKSSNGLYDFKVVCDNSNNPPAAANAGILVLTIALIPQIPIHEIQLQIVISKQGVSFSEVLNQIT